MNIDEEIKKLYLVDGKSGIKIADELGIKMPIVYARLKKMGITRSNKINSRKYYSNNNKFNIIDTEDKAYWLGFMYADGFISNVRNCKNIGLSLATKDIDHLEMFKAFLEATNPINEYISSGYSNTPYGRLLISSDELFDDLNRLGCVEHKSLVLRFPDYKSVSRDLIYHFIRGYFDGDGSISISGSRYKFRLCGTSSFLNDVLLLINKPHSVLQKRKKDDKDNWSIDIGGNHQVIKVLDIIYKDATIYMKRKYNRYINLKSLYPERYR